MNSWGFESRFQRNQKESFYGLNQQQVQTAAPTKPAMVGDDDSENTPHTETAATPAPRLQCPPFAEARTENDQTFCSITSGPYAGYHVSTNQLIYPNDPTRAPSGADDPDAVEVGPCEAASPAYLTLSGAEFTLSDARDIYRRLESRPAAHLFRMNIHADRPGRGCIQTGGTNYEIAYPLLVSLTRDGTGLSTTVRDRTRDSLREKLPEARINKWEASTPFEFVSRFIADNSVSAGLLALTLWGFGRVCPRFHPSLGASWLQAFGLRAMATTVAAEGAATATKGAAGFITTEALFGTGGVIMAALTGLAIGTALNHGSEAVSGVRQSSRMADTADRTRRESGSEILGGAHLAAEAVSLGIGASLNEAVQEAAGRSLSDGIADAADQTRRDSGSEILGGAHLTAEAVSLGIGSTINRATESLTGTSLSDRLGDAMFEGVQAAQHIGDRLSAGVSNLFGSRYHLAH